MYRWIEHTGELELELEAASDVDIFSESLVAIGELVGNGELGEAIDFHIELAAADRGPLLVDWLNELVYLIETEAFEPSSVGELSIQDGNLKARVEGHRGNPSHLVKAVTLNRLEFGEHAGVWRARVVLDV